MKVIPPSMLAAVSAAAQSGTVSAALSGTAGYAPAEEGGEEGGGSTTYTFTINPAWFTYDAGPENGGLQITESAANWSGGTYWLFQDEFYEPVLALLASGTSYSPGTYVADLAEFATELGAALDTPDAGLSVTLTGDNSEIFTVTFTSPPTIGAVPIVYLSYYSELGSSPAFTNPASLVEA